MSRLGGFLAGRSLRARLLLSAAAFFLVAILAIGLVMNGLLERFVRGEIASRLDLQIATLAGELERPTPDRRNPTRSRLEGPPRRFMGPPFDRGRDGWYWQVTAGTDVLATSRSLGNERLPQIDAERGRRGPPDRLLDIEGPGGEALVARARDVPAPGGPYLIVATAPLDAVRAPLRNAALTIAATLALLGLGLAAAILLQVRFALRPLELLRQSLGEVREGRRERIGGPQPLELQPLANELDALLAHDAETLRQARLHVANLAHGLKTPLATLAAQAARLPGEAERREWLNLTELMDRRIRHHLRRARSAARGGPSRHRTELRPRLEDLAAMLTRFGSGPARTIAIDTASDLAVAVDAEDLDEMAGNLLDNAVRHARSRVVVAAVRNGRRVRLVIEDDGDGLDTDEIAAVLKPGARLDETLPGHGFGLPITAEIAELYGGSLRLRRTPLGGLAAELELPAPTGGG